MQDTQLELPKSLVDQVRSGNVVLFLGAGATKGALHPQGITGPSAQQLATSIAREFLGPGYANRPLGQVVDLAVSERDLTSVQAYVAKFFNEFGPAYFHRLVPTFVWAAIATTNFDLVIERAYDEVPDRAQMVVPFRKDGERVDSRLRSGDTVLLKLHGCISSTDDPLCPLILTPDQYITHRRGRQRLFERLHSLSYEYPFIFVGYSLEDPDLRAILLDLDDLGASKPRSYLVAPGMLPADKHYWENRKLACIDATFERFITALDASIPRETRALATFQKAADAHPIARRFAVADRKPSDSLRAFLDREVEYIHPAIKIGTLDPKAFYQGYFSDWAPVASNLDVKRRLCDDIISEVLLSENQERATQEFVIIKGAAGSGKTVLLRRLGWTAATEFDKLCLYAGPGLCSYEPLHELYLLTKQRIVLLIDSAADHLEALQTILSRSRRDRIPITVIAAERFSEWNTACDSLESLVTGTYEMTYLSEREISELLLLLERHSCLGHLASKTDQQRFEDLAKRAGRQLLVALHEATLGRPFEDIVVDEFERIANPDARRLYLTVCVLHRLGVRTRAGLVSRVHRIPFNQFKDQLFRPLEHVVFARKDGTQQDYVYESRHSHIAEIVFDHALGDMQARYDEYIRIVTALDVDYSSDHEALISLMNGRRISELFTADLARELFKIAADRAPREASLLQHEAIFEMRVAGGNLERAAVLLDDARRLRPRSLAILHSQSELAFRRAERATNDLEKTRYRRQTRELCAVIIKEEPAFVHPYHTLAKVHLQELRDVIAIAVSPEAVDHAAREVEQFLSLAMQRFPSEEFLLDAEATFCQLLNDVPSALAALERAFATNKRSPFIAVRLARLYEYGGRRTDAIRILRESLDVNPGDRDMNFRLAQLLTAESDDPSIHADIKHCLRKSFSKGDARHEARFWYARLLYLEHDFEGAQELFAELESAKIDAQVKRRIRGHVKNSDGVVRYRGALRTKEAFYGLIDADTGGRRIFAPAQASIATIWRNFSTHDRVTYALGFNFRGPVATDVLLERQRAA